MAVRLWAIMMVLVLLTVGFMWIFQVVLMARNYIESKINEVQAQLDPIMWDLETEDLAYNEQMLSDLSSTADGKMLIINDSGQLAEMYTFGHPIDLSANHSDVQVWERIANGENYPKILAGKPYTSERMDRSRVKAYEIGIPIRYHGEDAYLILYHSFEELYNVLDMNRRQLVILSVILTAAAAVLAAFLARRFTRPIRVIKRTVDRLAAGELTAVPGLDRRDEIGQLSHSVEELGQALQRVDVLRKEVIANVSHELRSPLALIGGYAEMVRDITWKDDQQRNENLDLIIRETNRMSETVRDIMDYSQFQSGYLQLNKGDYGLREIVWEEAGRWEKIARENHLTPGGAAGHRVPGPCGRPQAQPGAAQSVQQRGQPHQGRSDYHRPHPAGGGRLPGLRHQPRDPHPGGGAGADLGAVSAQSAPGGARAGHRHRPVHRQVHPGRPRDVLWGGLPGRSDRFLVFCADKTIACG